MYTNCSSQVWLYPELSSPYLEVFAKSRVDAARGNKNGQHASERKLSDDSVGAPGEGPNGVAIGR